jgi:hypothetical protein
LLMAKFLIWQPLQRVFLWRISSAGM